MAKRIRRQSNRQSRAFLIMVLMVVLTVIVACGVKSYSLHRQSRELAITESQLEAQLKTEMLRTEDLENREKYMKTKKYIEDEAKNKLGLVNKDEYLIKPKDIDE
ncbi:MAG: septum formation initiator [Eubacterium sp.]|nr:septum formation initiator [Eubacterium sp.]